MRFYADLHIHSKYSRATSRDCDLEHLTYWGRKKGITVIGTGDFTHPAWIAEIKEKLVPAEPGFFRLKDDFEDEIMKKLPPVCRGTTRFMLSVEVSTIYKKGDKTRKVHHLIYAPTVEKAEAINRALARIGNIRSDGRPILGLDSRHLLEIVLEAGEDCFLVPAHIWTPWFSVLGSKSGFDAVSDCYGDLAPHIFAVETGLSSDPEMNRRVSSLDGYRLISNSDAHSPQKLGREACYFDCGLDYFSLRRALETGQGYGGTVEFFPEEGKYHMDGHRACQVRFTPEESRKHNGICPECRKPLTLGVMYRVEELADRTEQETKDKSGEFKSLIPLPEMIAETLSVGPASKAVCRDYENMVSDLGAELDILSDLPLDQIRKKSSSLITEAIARMRDGRVIREAGYDGEYGRIKLFREDELKTHGGASVLFDVPEAQPAARKEKTQRPDTFQILPTAPKPPKARPSSPEGGLDPEQTAAVRAVSGPLLIVAGPGSGKTRVLTHRIAHLIQNCGAAPEACLALTFSRRAAGEIKSRLESLLGQTGRRVPVMTFHGLGYKILEENRSAAGLDRGFTLAREEDLTSLLAEHLSLKEAQALRLLREISKARREDKSTDADVKAGMEILEKEKALRGLVDFDDLLLYPLRLFQEDPGLEARAREQYRWILIDEYQDIDPLQYRLARHLAPRNGNVCAIGDPDQAIYGFRGSDVRFFLKFAEDFEGAAEIRLKRNYRSGVSILSASSQMILPASLVPGRGAEALLDDPGKVLIHHAPTDKSEAEFIVEQIEKMIGALTFFSMDSGRSEGQTEKEHSFSDFAVLYRTEQQVPPLEEALLRSGIPFQRRSHRPLHENPLAAALLSAAEEEEATLSLGAALRRGAGKIAGQEALEALFKDPVFLRLDEIARACGSDRPRFFSEARMAADVDAWDERADAVSLMTLHAAKGLEFPVVFIAGCEEGVLPMKWSAEMPREELAEERRLFYVGMTRAKERLFLSGAAKRLWQGKIREQEPSSFLKDIEQKLLERIERQALRKPATSPQLDLL
ncbi:MAG TPA: UvrD-helicase domain-containing protein [Verrucomicrobiae bacterium]|nr:UvrD-helicase domain-containing protein [Verrucomicrobiae bacterium]